MNAYPKPDAVHRFYESSLCRKIMSPADPADGKRQTAWRLEGGLERGGRGSQTHEPRPIRSAKHSDIGLLMSIARSMLLDLTVQTPSQSYYRIPILAGQGEDRSD